ncbi:MAG: homoprotocatechuate degradation operon regulator HpaR [Pseudomonadota bacterium]|jgi:homoprotocatechuate degradation regulator HpaR
MVDRTLQVFGTSLPMSLLRARETVVQRFRQALRRHQLNETQWRVLRVLAEFPEVTASALARETAILSPSLSRMLVTMESRGLIQRKSGTEDQRQTLVSMSGAGRKVFLAARPDVEAVYAGMRDAFGEERLDRLHAELEALRRTLSNRKPTGS